MMLAATHFDPVVGVDVHMIQPPGPVPPLPIPHPYVGIHFDPFDYAPIIGSTILVNGVHRAIAGTTGKAVPPHIPIGGVFVPVLPGNEHEAFMGSLTVAFDGDAANYMGLPCLSCQSIGIPPPPRLNPKKGTKINVPVAPLSVVLPIAKGPPVLIGGPPTISLMSLVTHLIGPFAQLFGMTRAGRGLAAAGRRAANRVRAAAKKAWRKAFAWMPPGFLKCNVLKAEPVDVRTGEVVMDQLDFELPGRIPLRWRRYYRSSHTRVGVCGHGWDTPADARLELKPDGSVLFLDGEGSGALFDESPLDGPVTEPVDGWVLDRSDTHWTVRKKGGLTWFFPVPSRGQIETPVDAVMDTCGNSVHFLRGPQGLERVIESAGRSFEVLSRGGLVQQIALHHPDFPERRVMARFDYDDERRLVAAYDALDHPYRFEWHPGCKLARHTSRSGLSFMYEYDAAGRCVHTWGDGGLYDYHFRYDPDGRWTNFTDSLGHHWSVELDERGNLVAETDPLGGVTSYAYDAVGRTIQTVDPLGRATRWAYDEAGNETGTTRADGVATQSAYDDRGLVVSQTDGNGQVWHYDYDAKGLLVETRNPLGASVVYRRTSAGDVAEAINAMGVRTGYVRDRFGLVRAIVDPDGTQVEMRPDMLGNVVATAGRGQRLEFAFDPKGRLLEERRASGSATSFAYDADDRLIEQRDPEGRVTQFRYSALTEISEALLPDGRHLRYRRDTEERLLAVEMPDGRTWRFERDALGRVVRETDGFALTRTYRYDAAGQLTAQVAGDGPEVSLAYDEAGRLVRRILPDQTEVFAYDGVGYLTLAENADARIAREYDGIGNLLRETQDDFTIEYEYDALGRRTLRRSGDGHEVAYRYDANDQFTQVNVGSTRIAFQRHAHGRVAREVLGDGLSREYAYDEDLNLVAQRTMYGDSVLVGRTFGYDRTGNLIRQHNAAVAGANREQDLLYDAEDRLQALQTKGDATRYYDYGPDGTLLQPAETTGNGWTGRHEHSTYRFDGAGNLASRSGPDGDMHFDWDGLSRLRRVQKPHEGIVTFRYDALGRRVEKRSEAGSVRFFWDGDTLAAQHGDAERKAFVFRPGSFVPLCAIGADVEYFDADQIGLVREVISASGELTWSAAFDGFGAADVKLRRTDCPWRLQGQYFDEEIGLSYVRHRYFDHGVGSFISRDPLGFQAGPNQYWLGPNVWGWIDPLGLICLDLRNPKWGPRGRFRDPNTGHFVSAREVQGKFPHTVTPPERVLYRTDPHTRVVTYYHTYDAAGLPVKRVDINPASAPHGGVPPPHVNEFTHNTNPHTGQVFANQGKTVRPADTRDILK